MPVDPVARGSWGTVEWAVDAAGKAPGRDFFSGLQSSDAAKMQALFNRLAEHGKIANNQKFKKLGDMQGTALWEFKSFQLRFLGAFAPGGRFLLADGLRKKKDAHSRGHLERAARILNEHRQAEEQSRVMKNEALSRGPSGSMASASATPEAARGLAGSTAGKRRRGVRPGHC